MFTELLNSFIFLCGPVYGSAYCFNHKVPKGHKENTNYTGFVVLVHLVVKSPFNYSTFTTVTGFLFL